MPKALSDLMREIEQVPLVELTVGDLFCVLEAHDATNSEEMLPYGSSARMAKALEEILARRIT